MPLIVPSDGLQGLLTWAFVTNDPGLYLCLYSNNYTPVYASSLIDFTPATFDGYAPVLLANWDPPALDGFDRAYTSPDTVTFTRGPLPPAENIYGYYVVDNTFSFLMWAERFASGPYYLGTAGQQLQVTAYFTDKSEF